MRFLQDLFVRLALLMRCVDLMGCVSFDALPWMARQGDWMRILYGVIAIGVVYQEMFSRFGGYLKFAPGVDAICESMLKCCFVVCNIYIMDRC